MHRRVSLVACFFLYMFIMKFVSANHHRVISPRFHAFFFLYVSDLTYTWYTSRPPQMPRSDNIWLEYKPLSFLFWETKCHVHKNNTKENHIKNTQKT